MSNRSGLRDDSHHSTLHAFFLAAKDSGCTDFELQLVRSPKGRIEFCIYPRGRSEMNAKFDVRGNMVRAAVRETNVSLTDETDVSYGGTRSGRNPSRFDAFEMSSSSKLCSSDRRTQWEKHNARQTALSPH
jgi:hypothetical protein